MPDQGPATALVEHTDRSRDVDQPRGRSRRDIFRSAGAFAAFWGAAASTASRAKASDAPSADVDPGSILTKLVRRLTFGITAEELAIASQRGYSGYLEYHLNLAAIDNSVLDAWIAANLPTLAMTPMQLYAESEGLIQDQLVEACIRRAVFSKRQLFERVVEFWTDHFNIDFTNGLDSYLKTVDDRDVIRANALNTFPALLSASAHSPAMLYYLNNNTNIAGNPNENYARELMELHTLGVTGGYTQQDVYEVARCFTGWTLFSQSSTNPTAGTFRFRSNQHDNTQKVVLGHIIPAGGGQQDGETVLSILANHPSTAAFIAGKLCRRFLSENVPQYIINDVAATYTATGGDIKAMLRTAFKPNYLFDAAPKYKRPFHHFVSAMRALPTTINSTSAIANTLDAAGNLPFLWGPPDGYPDQMAHWVGLVLPRWNFGAQLPIGQVSGVTVDTTAFYAGVTTAQQVIDKLDQTFFAGEMPPLQKARILQFLQPDPPNPTTTEKRDAIGLAIGSPEFQWY